jgi:hypothetical protein
MLRHFIHASKLVRLAHFAFRLQFPHQAHSQTQFVWPKKTSSLISASVFQFLLFPKQTQFVWPTFSSLLPAPQAREPVAGRNTEHEQTSPATQFVWPKKRPRPSFRFLFSNFCFSQNKLSSFGQIARLASRPRRPVPPNSTKSNQISHSGHPPLRILLILYLFPRAPLKLGAAASSTAAQSPPPAHSPPYNQSAPAASSGRTPAPRHSGLSGG